MEENEALDPEKRYLEEVSEEEPTEEGERVDPEPEDEDPDAGDPPTEDASEEGDEDPDESEDEDKAKKKPQVPASKRIGQLTAKWREAEREAEYWQKRALEGTTSEKPKADDFEDEAEYTAALAAWQAETTINERTKKESTDGIERAKNERQAAMAAAYNVRAEMARDEFEDFDKVAHGAHWNPEGPLLEAILTSENGPALAYHLGSNPDKAEELSGLSPLELGIAVGRLESDLSQPKTKRKAKTPPPPPKTLKGKDAATPDPDTLSDDQWYAQRQKKALAS